MMKMFNKIAFPLFGIAMTLGLYSLAPPPRQAAAQFVDQSTYGGTSAGTANAQTFTVANYNAYLPGVQLKFIPGNTNTGPTQINVSSIGLMNVVRPSSIGNVALSGGELQAGELTCVTYNGTALQLSCNVDLTPIGRTIEYRGAATPRGTLIEDGSCVSRVTFAPLFSVIGTTYGACDGSTTFGVPDSRGTMFAALDTQGANGAANRITSGGSNCNATVLGNLCGGQNATLTALQLPTISSVQNGIGFTAVTGGLKYVGAPNWSTSGTCCTGGVQNTGQSTNTLTVGDITVSGSLNVAATSSNTGGQSHPILNPVLIGRRSIKY
jgi:microcystin-dependent protein